MKFNIDSNGVLTDCHSDYEGEDIFVPDNVKKILAGSFANADKPGHIFINDGIRSISAYAFERFEEVQIHYSAKSFSVLPVRMKRKAALLNLSEYADTGKIERVYEEYIKRARKYFFRIILKANDQEKAGAWLKLCEPDLCAVEDCIEAANDGSHAEIMAELLAYKNSHFTEKQLQASEERRFDKAIGLRPYTLADWRKIYSFKPYGDGYVIAKYKGAEKNVVIPDVMGKRKVVRIGRDAFMNTNISSVTVPESVEYIEDQAFGNCRELAYIDIPENTGLGECVFRGCKSLAEGDFVIVRDILFDCAGGKEAVKIPEGVKHISSCIWMIDHKISSIEFPSTLESIAEDMVCWCPNLSEIHLPEGVRKVHKYAFAMTKLDLVTYPRTLEKITVGMIGQSEKTEFFDSTVAIDEQPALHRFCRVNLIAVRKSAKTGEVQMIYPFFGEYERSQVYLDTVPVDLNDGAWLDRVYPKLSDFRAKYLTASCRLAYPENLLPETKQAYEEYIDKIDSSGRYNFLKWQAERITKGEPFEGEPFDGAESDFALLV